MYNEPENCLNPDIKIILPFEDYSYPDYTINQDGELDEDCGRRIG